MLFGILCLIILIVAIWLWFRSRQQRAATGLPFGARIVYADTGAWSKIEQPLFSRRYALTGKPDYIVQDQGATIPIEVKPNRVAPSPYESDVMQLAAYGLLIEETYGTFPRYGLLKYRDAVFQIDFTADLRAQVIALIQAMQQSVDARPVVRHHTDPARCRACGYRAECGQAL
jgi:CRISPR-associated exonuclease Cas4